MRMCCVRFQPAKWQSPLRMWKSLSAGGSRKNIICRNQFPALLVLLKKQSALEPKVCWVFGGVFRRIGGICDSFIRMKWVYCV